MPNRLGCGVAALVGLGTIVMVGILIELVYHTWLAGNP